MPRIGNEKVSKKPEVRYKTEFEPLKQVVFLRLSAAGSGFSQIAFCSKTGSVCKLAMSPSAVEGAYRLV